MLLPLHLTLIAQTKSYSLKLFTYSKVIARSLNKSEEVKVVSSSENWIFSCFLWFKGELNPKIDFSPFEHLGIVEQLYEVFLSC